MHAVGVGAAARLSRDALAAAHDGGLVSTHAALRPGQAALLGRVRPEARRQTGGGGKLVHHVGTTLQS